MVLFFQESSPNTFIWISSIITWFLVIAGFFANYLLLHKGYKDEYYKKIIDKRLQAYELVETVLSKMKSFGETLDLKGFQHYHSVFETKESYLEFYELLLSANEKSYLFSKELDAEFKQFGYFVYGNIFPPSKTKETAIEHFAVLQKHCDNIENLIKRDLKGLYEVESFLNERRIKLSETLTRKQQPTITK